MSRQADAPLEKVTLNLYKRDVAWFRERYGQGYTEIIRRAVRVFADSHRHERNEDYDPN